MSRLGLPKAPDADLTRAGGVDQLRPKQRGHAVQLPFLPETRSIDGSRELH